MPTFRQGAFGILVAVAALPLNAQNFGEITGTVSDSTGAVIARALVTATSQATNQVRSTNTNETGNYSCLTWSRASTIFASKAPASKLLSARTSICR
jgi:hypothetical protein